MGLFAYKKMQRREFLMMCVDIANANSHKEEEVVFNKAIEGGVFLGDFESSGWVIEQVISDNNFKIAVKIIAQLLSDGEPFTVIFEGKGQGVEINEDFVRPNILDFNETKIKFCKTGSKEEITCFNSELFRSFFPCLLEYAEEKGVKSPMKVPLGLCLECGAIFLGRRRDQRFCSREHGHRWRVRESYRKSKEEPDAPS